MKVPSRQCTHSDELQSEKEANLFGNSDYAHSEAIQLWVVYFERYLNQMSTNGNQIILSLFEIFPECNLD